MPNPDNCRFTKTHEWIFVEGNSGTVGITDHAQHEITDVVFVELPGVGKKVVRAEACCVVESVKSAFDIYPPVSGEITGVNSELGGNPALINKSPYEKGWLFRIKISDPEEADSFMTHSQYQEFLKK